MSKLFGLHELVLAVLLVGLMVVAGLMDPTFMSWRVQSELSRNVWPIALVAIPMMLIILTGGIDLSVGSTMALSAVVFGVTYSATQNLALSVTLALAAGIVAGGLNGVVVARFGVHPLIVTLATMAAFRGIAEGVSLGQSYSGFPESFLNIGGGSFAGLPITFYLFAGLVLLAVWQLTRGRIGRELYMIGLNEKATRFSGVDVTKTKLKIYLFSGAVASLAGLLLVARHSSAKANLGMGYELDVITAVVLGGVSIYGGRGSIIGVVLGVLLVHETKEFLSWRWNLDELSLLVVGALLIVSVLIQTAVQKIRKERVTV